MSAVDISNLYSIDDMKCNPSHTHVFYRRFKKKQIQVKNTHASQRLHQKNIRKNSEVMRQNAVHHCSTCYEVEHNVSTCCRPHN